MMGWKNWLRQREINDPEEDPIEAIHYPNDEGYWPIDLAEWQTEIADWKIKSHQLQQHLKLSAFPPRASGKDFKNIVKLDEYGKIKFVLPNQIELDPLTPGHYTDYKKVERAYEELRHAIPKMPSNSPDEPGIWELKELRKSIERQQVLIMA